MHSACSFWRYVFAWWQWVAGRVGRFVGHRPLLSLLVSASFVLICCLGFINASFVEQLDELWVPSNSVTVKDQNEFDATFPSNPFSRLERFIVVPRNSSRDLLNAEMLQQVFHLFDQVKNLTVEGGRKGGPSSRVGLQDMCSQPVKGAGCLYYSPLGYWRESEANMLTRTEQELHKDANMLLLSGNIPVQQRQVLGCMVKSNSSLYRGDEEVESVGALIFSFFMDRSKVSTATLERWETAFLNVLEDAAYPDIVAYGSSGVSSSQEISRQSQGDALLLVVSYCLMSLYMVLTLSLTAPLTPRILLGLGAVAAVTSAILAALGFTALFYQFNPLTVQVLPFLMLSIGMDSIFILFTHFRKSIKALPLTHTPSHSDLADALEDTMYRQGASVALTALTKAVSFLAPVIVLRIPALQQFCVVVAIAVIFELFLSLLAFNALQVLDARREFSQRLDILPCFTWPASKPTISHTNPSSSPLPLSPPPPLSDSTASPLPSFTPSLSPEGGQEEEFAERKGGEQVQGEETGAKDFDPSFVAHENGDSAPHAADGGEKADASPLPARQGRVSARGEVERRGGFLDLSEVEEEEKRSMFGRFIREFFVSRFLAQAWAQLLVLLVFAGLLAVGIYGCFTVEETLDLRSLITEGTQLYNYLGLEEKCNTRIGAPMFLVTQEANYTSLQTQRNLERLIENIENSTAVEPPVYSWYSDFMTKFLPYSNWSSSLDAKGRPLTDRIFYDALNDFLTTSLEGFPYTYDIIFHRDATTNLTDGIEASRMRTFFKPMSETKDFIHAMQDMRKRTKAATELKAYTQSYFYVFYEQFMDIVHQYILMLVLTITAIFIVTFPFMGITTAVVVSSLVLMIHIDMLGLAAEWGVALNAVSAVNAVAIMGLADEYVNYIMRGFQLHQGTAKEKVEWSLVQYIRPVSNAAISTLIGIVPLAFAKSAAYKVYYFRMFLIATLLSWLTGVVLLPTLLLFFHGEGLTSPLKRWAQKPSKEKTKQEAGEA